MFKTKTKNAKIVDLFEEYKVHRLNGASHEQALEHFDYLHPITLSRLKKMIVDNFVEDVDKKEGATA